MSQARRAPYRVSGLDEFGLPTEPPPVAPEPPPGIAQLSRRGMITAAGGLALGGMAVLSGLLADDPPLRTGQWSATGEPPIYNCAAWGARPPSSPVTVLGHRPVRILVHHTATANTSDTSPAELGELARSIQNFHMDDRGWLDTGQHFTISRGGYLAEGRHRSLRTLLGTESMVQGAHCPNQNDSSIGIENEGTYTDVQPPEALFATLIAMCTFVCRQYGIAATQLYGHRDFWDTECPGDKFYALLPALRAQVARQLAGSAPSPTAPTNPSPYSTVPTQPTQPTIPAPDLRQLAAYRSYYLPSWPLLRIDDQGPSVQAAQYLLRAAGIPNVPTDGKFGRRTADAVYVFQRKRKLPVNGMIGGGSWPLLAVPVRAGQSGDAAAAVQVLLRARGGRFGRSAEPSTTTSSGELATPNTADATDVADALGASVAGVSSVPSVITKITWQRLLDAAAPAW